MLKNKSLHAKIHFGLFLIFFLGCKVGKEQINDSNVFIDSNSQAEIVEPEPLLVEDTFDDWWVLKKHQLGKIKKSIGVDSSLSLVREEFEVIHDSLNMRDIGLGDGWEYWYEIWYNDTLIFKIYPDSTSNQINHFEALSPRFETEEGFKLGDNYKKLWGIYNLTNTHYDNNFGMYVYASDFYGTFHLNASEEYWTDFISDIPDTIEIDEIVVW